MKLLRDLLSGGASGALLIALAAIQWGLGGPFLLILGAFLIVASLVLSTANFSTRSLLLTWMAAMVLAAVLLSNVAGGVLASSLAGAVFGSLAVLPWIGITMAFRALLRRAEANQMTSRD